jgi:aconitate hydratase
MDTFQQIGGTVLANAVGPCIGQWKRTDVGATETNAIVSSFNRNFPGRNDGSASTLSFLTSPEIVTALAFAGSLEFDPSMAPSPVPTGARSASPRPRARSCRARGFAKGEEGFEAPAASGDLQVVIPPDSERLQILQPFPRWDGKDFTELPILVKTKGKTTTDHISPAGAWLRFRGHLDKISDNMFLGAVNAFTGEAGKGVNPVTGRRARRSPRTRAISRARHRLGGHRRRELRRGIEPRACGDVAPLSRRQVVLVRSFARIHETNLKKQGILPLTFTDAKDYDLFDQADRVSVRGSPR